MLTEEQKLEYSRKRWRNRRRMAWACLVASLFYPVLLVVMSDGSSLAQIAMPFYTFTGAVVSFYIGAATIDDKNFRDH